MNPDWNWILSAVVIDKTYFVGVGIYLPTGFVEIVVTDNLNQAIKESQDIVRRYQ